MAVIRYTFRLDLEASKDRMSSTESTTTTPLEAPSATRSAAVPLTVLASLALAPALLSISRINFVETWTAGGLLALVGLFFVFQRRLSTSFAEVALTILYLATLLNFSPLSVRTTLQGGWNGSSTLQNVAIGLPLGCAIFIALASLSQRGSGSPAAKYFGSVSIRVNLWIVACMALGGSLLLGGYPLNSLRALVLLLAAAAFSLRPVALLAAAPRASRVLLGVMAALLAANFAGGMMAYSELNAAIERGRAAVEAKNDAAAQAALNEAVQLNEQRVQSRSRLVETHRLFGMLHEQQARWESAIHHWRLVAEMTGVSFLEHPAVRRILVSQGDSLLGWKQLVRQGFSSMMSDELIPGFMKLGERPDADVRGTLLAALIRWEHNDPEKDRRESLERVLTKRANDVSANNLLSVLGRPLPKEPLWLGEDLLVATKPVPFLDSGALHDLGSADSLVFLTEGRWECRVQARGTPLDEEWPMLRVEINGVEALNARVNKSESMQLPFTFENKARNLYRIRFILENNKEVYQGNQRAVRSLNVEGVYFQRTDR